MRKNSIRKLIHGILDLLPLFIIPIFAININQKSVEPISIEVQEKISVDFNQEYRKTITNTRTMLGSVNVTWNEYNINFNGIVTNQDYTTTTNYIFSMSNNYLNLQANHTYMFKANVPQYVRFQQNFYKPNGEQDGCIITQTNNTNKFVNYIEGNMSTYIVFTNAPLNLEFENLNIYLNLFDLTEMNLEDISIQDFNLMFPEIYPYTESQKMLVDKPTPTTYDDTDIGSQFLYSLYISTDNYFNMNNVFNLNNVYSWFEMNIFGGSAPLSIYIVWNIIIYELVMDLLMLLYALFMFFIDACQKLIDKPLESIK